MRKTPRAICAIVLGLSLAHCSGSGKASLSIGEDGGAGGDNNGGNGAGGSGNPTPGDIPGGPDVVNDGTVTAKVSASRVMGVAPLAVLFDATETSGSGRPFHELHYVWDFGDADAGTWAQTGHGKNSATGAVAAHVFDKPGTYTVKVTARNLELKGSVAEVTITVTDPETVFASSTTCFANGTDFAGCPSSAKRVTTSDTGAIASAIGKGRRLLLRRGDKFMRTQELDLNGAGPIVLGAFGTCESPDARGICRNAPEIVLTSTGDATVINVGNEGRVMDLKLTGPTGDSETAGLGFSGIAPLVYRVRTRGFQTAGRSAFSQTVPDQLAIVDSDIGEANSNDLYVGSERLMLLGNHLHDSSTSHVLRVWHAYKASIAENLIENASVGGTNGRHALKLHGLAEGDGGDADGVLDGKGPNGGALQRTRFVHIADNTFGASPPWPVSIGPQFDGIDERILDVVFERNFFRTSGKVHPDAQPVDTPIHCTAFSDITVRNNIFDATGAGEDYTAIDVTTDDGSAPTATNVHFLNNLVYRSDRVGSRMLMARIAPGGRNVIVRNNLGVAPRYEASGRVVADDEGQGTSMDTNMYVDEPGFMSTSPQNPFDFRPAAGAATIDKGAVAPVIDDFTRKVRTAPIDLGPFEFSAP